MKGGFQAAEERHVYAHRNTHTAKHLQPGVAATQEERKGTDWGAEGHEEQKAQGRERNGRTWLDRWSSGVELVRHGAVTHNG